MAAAPAVRIPRLRIATDPKDALPGSHESATAGEAWHDAAGAVFAYCRRDGESHRILIPGVASFRFDPRADWVTAVRHPSASPESLSWLYSRYVLPLVLQALGTEVLHASAVHAPRGIVAFCGSSGTGKSTLAFGLARRGYPLWADDAVALDVSGGEVRSVPLPFEARLRPGAVAFFGSPPRDQLTDRPPDGPAPAKTFPVPVAAVCILARAAGLTRPVTIRPLPGPPALTRLLVHSYCFTLEDPRLKRRMVEHYLALTARVPVLAVTFDPRFEVLDQVLDGIEAGVVAAASSAA